MAEIHFNPDGVTYRVKTIIPDWLQRKLPPIQTDQWAHRQHKKGRMPRWLLLYFCWYLDEYCGCPREQNPFPFFLNPAWRKEKPIRDKRSKQLEISRSRQKWVIARLEERVVLKGGAAQALMDTPINMLGGRKPRDMCLRDEDWTKVRHWLMDLENLDYYT